MMRLPCVLFLAAVLVLVVNTAGRAAILGVEESNLGDDSPAIIFNGGFGEDVVAFADRVHQHNGSRFSDVFGAGTLSIAPSGFPETVVINVPLPAYMVGGDYVAFANDARDNVGYSAKITADISSNWYLLIDNRWDGPSGTNDASWQNDPVLGGKLQWVVDDGWQRVNTGITPPGELWGNVADYTGVDESPSDGSGLGVGPGVSVDNFYAVYTRSGLKEVTLGSLEMSGASMYGIVAVPIPEPASLMLLACGALGVAAVRRRFRR